MWSSTEIIRQVVAEDAVAPGLIRPGLPRDIPGSFAFLSRGIVLALQDLGLPAEIETVAENTRFVAAYLATKRLLVGRAPQVRLPQTSWWT